MYALSKQFRFDSAHRLDRDVAAAQKDASLRVHGHSYRAEVTLHGALQQPSGMVVDLDILEQALGKLHDALDHRMLNDVPGLGAPTMENLCLWIWTQLTDTFPQLSRVAVYRDSAGESCVYRGGK
jgi:6-pyruvoyltetrahydropterin/6-carboxytetrahydropterin synthase